MDWRRIITRDPKVRDGQPCIRGLPIAVADILGWLAAGQSMDEVLGDHSQLTRDDVLATLAFAAQQGSGH
jgi:uncharacterized protein (DUF433 family)